jgi:hypothetical protein
MKGAGGPRFESRNAGVRVPRISPLCYPPVDIEAGYAAQRFISAVVEDRDDLPIGQVVVMPSCSWCIPVVSNHALRLFTTALSPD